MPIHNLGYRRWSGTLLPGGTRWMVIAGIGIRRTWQSAWVRRLILMAWAPALLMGFLIFMFEQAAQGGDPETEAVFRNMVQVLLSGSDVVTAVRQAGLESVLGSGPMSPEESRHLFWSSLLMVVLRRTQLTMLVPMVGLIAPPLISQDIRSRAFLLYFSRPVSRFQYILGKAATLLLFLSLVTLVPAMVLYITGVLLSPDLSILQATWDLPLRIFAAAMVIVIPCTSLSLMFSSMTTESRFASFAWFTLWIFGYVAAQIVEASMQLTGGSVRVEMFSMYHLIGDICEWLLNVNTTTSQDIQTQIVCLCVVTIVSLAILFRQVSAPMRI
ncbi:MAG: ABC transporter permease subunit [Planctomycetaceae bacterium]|nr:ABC transporter permease subunit [Planctomycetaceae bacterium]